MTRRTDPKIVSARRSSATRIVFVNQLRGLAAMMVVFSHLGGVFVLMSPTVSWVTSSPQLHLGHPAILYLTCRRWLNFGPLGVGIFFLISGFVIPFSLGTQSSGRFLVARGFRIFPTFWVALTIEWLAVFAQSKFYGRGMAFPPLIYLENATLLDTAFNNGYVDLVNWTLAIEVKFYILMALLRPFILRGRVKPLIGIAVFGFAVAVAESRGLIKISSVLANEPCFIGFMMIGTLFYYRMSGLITYRKAFSVGALLAFLFLASWQFGPMRVLFPVVPANYLYALIIFWLAYSARSLFRPMRYLDFLADISFPLYLVHSIIGFSVMTFVIAVLKFPYAIALPCGFGSVIVLAYLIHKMVERPAMAFGKTISRMRKKIAQTATDSVAAVAGPPDMGF